ncbi:hypothetical protein BJY52DRAFT_1228884 [Lactarius psammicola]|nr:hypothetical protein BJY52DRAFT_1228884 [Lactarius psammicola]
MSSSSKDSASDDDTSTGSENDVYGWRMLQNGSAHDPKPLKEGQLEEEPFGDDQVWAVVLALEEQRHVEVMRQRAKYHGMSPSTDSCDKEEVERMLQDMQARMERLFLEPEERHLLGRHVTSLEAARRSWTMPYRSALGHDSQEDCQAAPQTRGTIDHSRKTTHSGRRISWVAIPSTPEIARRIEVASKRTRMETLEDTVLRATMIEDEYSTHQTEVLAAVRRIAKGSTCTRSMLLIQGLKGPLAKELARIALHSTECRMRKMGAHELTGRPRGTAGLCKRTTPPPVFGSEGAAARKVPAMD